jgi:hypothetical protein
MVSYILKVALLMRSPFSLIAATLTWILSLPAAQAQGATDVLSYHGSDLLGTGVNSNEGQLTPLNVNVNSFGKLFSVNITDVPNTTGMPSSTLPSGINYTAPAGQVYAEPLVKTGVNITTGNSTGLHDVVFVATSMDSLFAIDANTGAVLWKDSFLYNATGNPNPVNAAIPAGVTAVPGGYNTETNSQDLSPWIGIVSTPVIDGAHGYIYLVAKTREVHGGDQANPHYVSTLHKIRLSDGLDTNVVMADTTLQTSNTTFTFNSGPYVLGTGDGATQIGNQSRIYFNAVRQMVRPALELYNGRIYIGSGSHGDNQPYHGWILTYDATTLACNGVWNATPTGTEGEGGVWQGGGGVVIDSNGYIYFETGNGQFDGNNDNNVVTGLDANGFPINGNYGDCFVKLALDPTTTAGNQGTNKNGWGLTVVDYFSPYNNHALDTVDRDLGSGGPTILPDSVGSATHPHLLVGGGKQGTLYLIDRDNMGKFGTTDNVVQSFSGAVNATFCTAAFFNGRLYSTSGYGGPAVCWPLAGATISTTIPQVGPDSFAFPGCSPYISSNSGANGIVWAIDKGTNQLRAYDASNLTSELWTSNLNSSRDGLGSAVKFSVATPANGHVYVGTADHLVVYGLLVPPTGPPSAPTGLTAAATSYSSISLSWTDNSNDESGFRIERSTDNVNFTEVGSVGANVMSFADTGLTAETTYYYRVRAFNLYNTLSFSVYTNTASATTSVEGTYVPANLYHFDEGSGTVTVDSAGGNNGTLVGSPLPGWILPGEIGNAALSFSGDGVPQRTNESAVQVANDLSPVLGQTSSLLFWIKTTQVGNNVHFQAPAVTGVEAAGSGNDINWGYIDGSGHIGVAVGDSGSVLSANPINDGQWHHIGLTRDSVGGTVNVYVDGALSATGLLEVGAKTTPFYLIGGLSDETGGQTIGASYFNGQLDDVQVYPLVVPPSWISYVALYPAAPTNLVVTPASGTELDLNWTDNATNETGFEVWSSVNGGPFELIAQLPANTTSYADTGLSPGTPFSYFVRAVNSYGVADSSVVDSGTTVPPATPSGAFVSYLAPTEIDLAWIDNATNETGYNILRRAGSGNFLSVATLPANSVSYRDMAVQAATSYDYHIQAFNIAGYSDFAGLTITTPAQSQYLSYLAPYNLSNNSPLADPDNIGIPNLLAYALNLNPTVSAADGLPTTSIQNGYLTISFVERIPPTDLNYTVQVSSDLVNWKFGPAYTTQVSVTPIDAATQWVTVRDNVPVSPNTAAKRFIRLNVTH